MDLELIINTNYNSKSSKNKFFELRRNINLIKIILSFLNIDSIINVTFLNRSTLKWLREEYKSELNVNIY